MDNWTTAFKDDLKPIPNLMRPLGLRFMLPLAEVPPRGWEASLSRPSFPAPLCLLRPFHIFHSMEFSQPAIPSMFLTSLKTQLETSFRGNLKYVDMICGSPTGRNFKTRSMLLDQSCFQEWLIENNNNNHKKITKNKQTEKSQIQQRFIQASISWKTEWKAPSISIHGFFYFGQLSLHMC